MELSKEQMEDTLLELIENDELTEFQFNYILEWLSGNRYVNDARETLSQFKNIK